jgi:stage II sporulation protein D
MKTLIAAALLCGAISPIQGQESALLEKIAEPMSPRNIQILLEKDAREALLEVKGPYYIFNPHDGSRVASGLLGKRFMIRELDSGLKWGEEFPGIHQIYIKPRSAETSIFVNGIQYSGAIAIYGVAGNIHIINDVDIETYVKSILTSQFPTPFEPEVLSALAILTRTDAYYHANRAEESFWHISAQETAYQGSALVVANSPIEKAVETTRHLILVHPESGKNLPFATAWTEHSAGKTAAYQTIFRKNELTPGRGVEAPHAALARQDAKWSYQISKRHLAQALGLPQVKSVELFTDPQSQKTYGIRIHDGQETHDLDFLALQEKMGKEHLLSSDFTISTKDDAFVFTGFGKGPGVGLCLYSATALAQNGYNAVKILSKFFPNTYLYNLNALPNVDSFEESR